MTGRRKLRLCLLPDCTEGPDCRLVLNKGGGSMVRGLSQRRLLLAAVLQCLHLPVMRHSPPAASDA